MCDSDSSRRKLVNGCLRTMFNYSTLAAIYLMANTISHPQTMAMPLTHVFPWPTEGLTLGLALLCSAISFFVLRLIAYSGGMSRGSRC